MSIEVMTWVWKNSKQEGGALLVLLAMADFANDDGVCWPSVSTLARKSRLKERQIFYILSELRRAGEIETVKQGGGSKTSTYRVTMGQPTPAKMTGVQQAALPMQPSAVTTAPDCTRSIIEPLVRTIISKAPPKVRRRKIALINFQDREWEEGAFWLRKFLLNEQDTFTSPNTKSLLDNYGWWDALNDSVGGVVDLEFLRLEFAKMKRWMIRNPTKCPIESNVLRFVEHWLDLAVERKNQGFGKEVI